MTTPHARITAGSRSDHTFTPGVPRAADLFRCRPILDSPPTKPAPAAFLESCGGYPAPRAEGLDPAP